MWIEICPKTSLLNDPTYYPPALFGQLLDATGGKPIKLLAMRDPAPSENDNAGNKQAPKSPGTGRVALFLEIDDALAGIMLDYAKNLLNADAFETSPPPADFKLRAELTMEKACAYPITHLTRTWIDRNVPSSQNQLPLPIPADQPLTAVVNLGTAIEIVAKNSKYASAEVASKVKKLQKKGKIEEGLPIPGDKFATEIGDSIFGTESKKPGRGLEPARDKKLEVASEKLIANLFECNVFVYGNDKQAIEATIMSLPRTSLNGLKLYKIENLEPNPPLPLAAAGAALRRLGKSIGGCRTRHRADGRAPARDGKTATGTATATATAITTATTTGAGASSTASNTGKNADADAGSNTGAGAAGNAQPLPVLLEASGLVDAAASRYSPPQESERRRPEETEGKNGTSWTPLRQPKRHLFAKNRNYVLTYFIPAAAAVALAIHALTLSPSDALRRTIDGVASGTVPATHLLAFFLPELTAIVAAGAVAAALALLVKTYKPIVLSEFEIAALFSFPSAAIPTRKAFAATRFDSDLPQKAAQGGAPACSKEVP